ncbi:MAG: DUF4412 domain-containing protein [Gammaproteobacteria bacterium]|nr:DUF4412 domain-containing protein [Gammaproteobacteria bacterium]
MKNILFSLTALCLFTLHAAADTTLEYRDAKTNKISTVYRIAGDKVRIEHDGSDGDYILHSLKSNAITIVDTKKKQYTVMDKASLEQIQGQVNAAMQEMRAQLEQMPAEQRAMMEKMMGGMKNMIQENFLDINIEKTGRRTTAANYDCEIVNYSIGTVVESELCIAGADDLDINKADYQTLTKAFQFFMDMADGMAKQGLGLQYDLQQLNGLPVRNKDLKSGQATQLSEISSDKLSADLFEVPANYKRMPFNPGE